MDPYAGLEINATTTCVTDNGVFCTSYVTSIPSDVVGDILFALSILVFLSTFMFLGAFFNTFTRNTRN